MKKQFFLLSLAIFLLTVQFVSASIAVATDVKIILALHLGTVFADDSLQGSASYSCIQDGSGWFGLISESGTAAAGNLSGNYNLNSSFVSSNKALLAAGKGSCAIFNSHAAEAWNARFLEPLKSFAYAGTSLVQMILNYSTADFSNDAHWGGGTYLLSIKDEGFNSSSGRDILRVKVVK